MQGKKSRALIRRELLESGVAPDYIEDLFETEPADEEETIFRLLCKKAGEPHKLEEKELRRSVAYLARKGFSSAEIWKQVKRYQNFE